MEEVNSSSQFQSRSYFRVRVTRVVIPITFKFFCEMLDLFFHGRG